MDIYLLILRIVHLFAGVFWVGTVFFFALFLLPRVKAAGPLGGQFMQRLMQPPLTGVIAGAAGLTVLSGLLLYWRDSGGFQWAWVVSPTGLAFTMGGLTSIVAAAIGGMVSRPVGGRMEALGRDIGASGGEPTPAQMEEMQLLAARLERALYQTAYLVLIALLGMAVARYL